MWKVKEIADKVTNVVMNYTEPESKVREATNDQAWGPHGSLMAEISQLTNSYEAFPEVMGMLWKRMLHENRRDWRRVYKVGYEQLIRTKGTQPYCCNALMIKDKELGKVRNGSERVVSSAREHTYDMRQLESYTFTDEHNRDQGINVRTKVKEILDMIGDDDRLREERKKARKLKDKYVGVSGGYEDYGGGYKGSGGGGSRMDDIDNFDGARNRRMNPAEQALDKVTSTVKDLFNNRTRRTYESGGPYGYGDDFNDDFDRGHNRSSSHGSSYGGAFKDDYDDFGGNSHSSPTRGGSNYSSSKGSNSYSSSRKTKDFDAGDDDDDDDDFNPRGTKATTNGAPKKNTKQDDDFADFSKFGEDSSNNQQQGEFADFASASFPSPPSGQSSPTSSSAPIHAAAAAPSPAAQQPNLLDDLAGLSISSAPNNTTAPSSNNLMMGGDLFSMPTNTTGNAGAMMGGNPGLIAGNSPMMSSGNTPMMSSGNTPMMSSGNTPMMGSGNTPMMGSGNTPMMGSGNTPMMGGTNGGMMMGQPMNTQQMMQSNNMMGMPSSQSMPMSMNSSNNPQSRMSQAHSNEQMGSTWNNTGVKVNIDLDNLGKGSQKQVAPSMNQLAHQPVMGGGAMMMPQQMNTGMMGQPMMGQQAGSMVGGNQPMMGGNQPMMGGNQPMMAGQMGLMGQQQHPNMMGGSMNMHMMGNMGMQSSQAYNTQGSMQQTPQQKAMQQRADSAFAGLGL